MNFCNKRLTLIKKIMKIETIEKAAKETLVNESVELQATKVGVFQRGFVAGAQWRINSVWQKPSAYGEELRRDIEVIAKTKRGFRFGKFDVVGYSNEYIGFVSTSSLEYALSDVLEYAYLSDLLPERKEEQS